MSFAHDMDSLAGSPWDCGSWKDLQTKLEHRAEHPSQELAETIERSLTELERRFEQDVTIDSLRCQSARLG